jgi:hypothetical protein
MQWACGEYETSPSPISKTFLLKWSKARGFRIASEGAMASSSTLTAEQTLDFDTVEAAVMETERGRWFLSEFARRQRANENAAILAALDCLTRRMGAYERTFEGRPAEPGRELQYEAMEEPHAPPQKAPSDLGERLSALREIDALDPHAKVKMFG